MKNNNARILPHSIEAEQAVIGCVLIDDDEARSSILSQLVANDFYSTAHKTIYGAMFELYNKHSNVDFITLTSKLEDMGRLNDVGGLNYITTLSNIVPSVANYYNYLKIVKNKSKLRQLIKVSEQNIEKTFNAEDDDINDLFIKIEGDIFKITDEQTTNGLDDVDFDYVMDEYRKRENDPNYNRGIDTGFYALDKILNGLKPADLAILAARPSVGKTALAMNIGVNIAMQGKNVAVFSLEMPKEQLITRMACGISMVDMAKYQRNELETEQVQALMRATVKLNGLNIKVDDSSLNTPISILNKAKKLKREKGLDFIIIDYLQLMSLGMKKESRQQEVSEMSRMLKIVAKELNVPILLLSQLSRAVEGRAVKKPVLSDLRDSGAIEQDADIVMFLYRDDYAKSNEANYRKTDLAEVIVAKHRNGALETAVLGFKAESTQFVNLTRDANMLSLVSSAEQKKIPF